MRAPWRRRTTELEPADAETKEVAFASYYRQLAAFGDAWDPGPWPIDRAIREGYERVVWVFKPVQTIAVNSAKLKFQLRQGDQTVDDHPLYQVMNKRANPLETGRMFRQRLSSQVSLSSRGAFVEVTKSRGGSVIRLDLLPPGRTYPVPGRGADLLDHYEVTDPRYGRIRSLPPERVRWIRDPHPTDPYAAITPLESLGLSVELDHFARLYNVSFLRNDKRPGGILGVESDMEESEMDRIEHKFGGGPVAAGRLTVLGGRLSYIDTARSPRDVAYGSLSKITKEEILSGFGVDESIFGLTANRTYDNAEQAEYNFWAVTMDAHNGIILSGLDEDSEDELEGFFDTSKIPSLDLPARKRREEARAEMAVGLRSPYSYAQLAEIDGVASTPATRALYLPGGLTPLATSAADAKALAKEVADAAAAAAPPPPEPPPDEAPPEEPPPDGTAPDDGSAGSGVADRSGSLDFEDPVELLAGVTQGKALTPGREVKLRLVTAPPPPGPVPDAPTDPAATPGSVGARKESTDRSEAALAATLAATVARLLAVTAARAQSPKARKGTRHWQPAPGETDTRATTAGLDAAAVVDPDRWATEVTLAAQPVLAAAATQTAAAEDVDLSVVLTPVLALLATEAGLLAGHVVASLAKAELAGAALPVLLAAISSTGARAAAWAGETSIQAVTATVEGVKHALAVRSGGTRVWRSRHDGRTRAAHLAADGQRQTGDSPFLVGGAPLRFPGDPAGPANLTFGCRCWTERAQSVLGTETTW